MLSVGSALSTALWGVHQAQSMALSATERIASGDLDHLGEDLVSLKVASTMHAANLTVVRTLDSMQQDVLDILA